MDENKNPIKMRLTEQLPSHTPDPGLWQLISAKLDVVDAEADYQEKLQQLPTHTPDQGTWGIIYSRLNRIAYYKTAARVALTAAAGLLLFFTVSQIFDSSQNKPFIDGIAIKQESKTLPSELKNTPAVTTPTSETQPSNNRIVSAPTDNNTVVYSTATQEVMPAADIIPATIPADDETALNTEAYSPAENAPDSETQSTPIPVVSPMVKDILNVDIDPKITFAQKEQNNSTLNPPSKYYTPTEPVQANKDKHFGLAMNYLPENIYNGTSNSLFHNVDFTASYKKEKVRFNTSLGMAYNEEQLEFDMNYNINTPVTAPGDDGRMDTVGYNVSTVEAQYQGTEKHQYFIYNLGFGRRLFSVGKFSTWINAGAGFGVKLNDPDLIASTEKSIKNQPNAQITNTYENASKPVYTDVNVNFVTGIDFNYKLFNRVSITFTPTSRWYFKPVLTINNQATDELTLGFKTGMKFDF